jgi:hypothetical protein
MLHFYFDLAVLKKEIDDIEDNEIVCYISTPKEYVIINQDSKIIVEKFRKENADILFGDDSESFIGITPFRIEDVQRALSSNRCIALDTKKTIFFNMHLIDWKDIWIKSGQIYNRILEETPAIVIFNFGSWRTNCQKNIMPIILEKMEKSMNTHLPLSIHKYTPSYHPLTQSSVDFVHDSNTRNVLSNIDKIFYINLDKRMDRRRDIEYELQRYGLCNLVERFPAISTPGRGIVGCTFSHLAVYKLAKERGYKNVVIFEDDFVFLSTKTVFYENMRKLFEGGVDFDVCMLAYHNTCDAVPTEYDFLLRTVEAQTAAGYIVNASIYDRLINLFEWAAHLLDETDQHWIYANDQVWKRLQQDCDVNWYCFKERIGKQQDGYSDNSEKFMELIEN